MRRLKDLTDARHASVLPIPLSDVVKAKQNIQDYIHTKAHKKYTRTANSEDVQHTDTSDSSSAATTSATTDAEADDDRSTAHFPPSQVTQLILGEKEVWERVEQKAPAALKPTSHKKAKPSVSWGISNFFWPAPAETTADSTSRLISLAGSAAAAVNDREDNTTAGNTPVFPATSPCESQLVIDTQLDAPSPMGLNKKILKETISDLTSGGYFFSQDFDLTRCTQKRWGMLEEEKKASPSSSGDLSMDLRKEEPSMSLTLSGRADKRFWWNNWMSKPFTDAGVSILSLLRSMY